MDALEFIRDKFSQDCSIDTVFHLVMSEYDLSEDEAREKINEYFEIIDSIDRSRNWFLWLCHNKRFNFAKNGSRKIGIYKRWKLRVESWDIIILC